MILGLGTGRCGTASLSSLLDDQSDTCVFHEGHLDGEPHPFHWNADSEDAIAWLETLAQRLGTRRFGDVAYYFLPHTEAILERWPDAKSGVLKRERSATVESFLRKTQGRNH